MPGVDVNENSIRIRQKDPDSFDSKSFRTVVLDKARGIKAVIGCPKGSFSGGKCSASTKIQTYIFDRAHWTPDKARKWAKEHKKASLLDLAMLMPRFPLQLIEQAVYTRDKSGSRISCVAAYRKKDNAFLIMKRNDSGKWVFPGGHTFPDETPDETARREYMEETGLELMELVHLNTTTIHDKDISAYKARIHNEEAEPTNRGDPDNEAASYRWCKIQELQEAISSTEIEWNHNRDPVLESLGINLPHQLFKNAADRTKDGRPLESPRNEDQKLLKDDSVISSSIVACSIPIPMSPDGSVPTEFKIWPVGTGEPNVEVEHGGGDVKRYIVDQRSISMILSNWKRRGIRLMGDYEHQSMRSDITGPVPASCKSFELEVRDGWLCAVNVKWTDRAAFMLQAGEYAYFSPVFDFDESGRITTLINFGLTNNPATNNLPALVAAALTADRLVDDNSIDPRTLDVAPRRGVVESKEGTMRMYTKLGEQIAAYLKSKNKTEEDGAKSCGLGVDAFKAMMEKGPKDLTAEHHAALPKLAKAMGVKVAALRKAAFDDEDEDDPDDGDGDGDEPKDKKKEKSKMSVEDKVKKKAAKATLRAAGLSPKELRKQGEVNARLEQELADRKAADDKREAEIATLRAQAKANEDALKIEADKRAAAEKKEEESRCASMIVAAMADKKLFTKEQQELARAHGAKYGSAELATFIAAMPQGGPGMIKPANERTTGPNGTTDPELACLTPEEFDVAKMLRRDAKVLAKFKMGDYQDNERFPGPVEISGFKSLKNGPGAAIEVADK